MRRTIGAILMLIRPEMMSRSACRGLARSASQPKRATASSGRSFPLETWYPAPGVTPTSPAERGFAPDFPARGAHKDVSLALAAGKLTGVRLPGVELAAQQFQQLMDEGLGDRDCSLIVKYASPDGTVRGFEQD